MPLKRLKKARLKILHLLLAVTLAFAPAAFANGQLCTMAEHMMHTGHGIFMDDAMQAMHRGHDTGDMGEPEDKMTKKCKAGYLCDGSCSTCAPASIGVISLSNDIRVALALPDPFLSATPIGIIVPTETPPPDSLVA